MKKMSVILSLGLVLAFLLAACGGAGAQTSYKMTMVDFAFQPTSLTVPAGKSITLTLVNNGSTTHDWTLLSKNITPPFSSQDQSLVLAAKSVDAGSTGTLTFTTPSTPGDYEIICAVAGHLESGMQATLHVTQ